MLLDYSHELGLWAYLLLAFLVCIEGPVATLAGAVAASAGLLKPGWVLFSAASGNITADCLWYTLGYLGKMEWLHRYGKWFGFQESQIARFRKDISEHAPKIVFVAKLTLGFMIPALVATGLARVPLRRWFPLLLLGEMLWTGGLVLVGYHFGAYVQRLERGISILSLIAGFVFYVLAITYLTYLRRKKAGPSDGSPSGNTEG